MAFDNDYIGWDLDGVDNASWAPTSKVSSLNAIQFLVKHTEVGGATPAPASIRSIIELRLRIYDPGILSDQRLIVEQAAVRACGAAIGRTGEGARYGSGCTAIEELVYSIGDSSGTPARGKAAALGVLAGVVSGVVDRSEDTFKLPLSYTNMIAEGLDGSSIKDVLKSDVYAHNIWRKISPSYTQSDSF